MALQNLRSFETYANGDPIVVDATKNIVAITGSPTVSTAAAVHGNNGARCHSGVVGGEAVTYGAAAVDTRSVYGEIQTAGAGTATVCAVKNGSTFLARVRANPTGTKWDIADQAGTAQATSTGTYAVGTPFRIDMQWSYSSGNITVTVRLFQAGNTENYAPDETIGPVTFASAATPNRWAFGTVNSAWAIDFDTVREYGDTSTWPVPFAATAALSQRPVLSVGTVTGWTVTGTSNHATALADETDTTYIQAGGGTSTERFWLGAGVVPDSDTLLVRCDETAPGGTLTFKLYEGIGSSTPLETIVVPVTTTLANYSISLNPATVAAVQDWTNLYFEWVAT